MAHPGHRADRRRGAGAGPGSNLDRVSAEIRAAAAELVGGPATDETVRRALDRLAAEHPDDASIVDLARVTLDEATDFVRGPRPGHPAGRPVRDPGDAGVRPGRGGGLLRLARPAGDRAACRRSTASRPPRRTGRRERVESFYREYNDHMIRNLTVHEAMPGHFLQLAHARRYRGSTRVRALTGSGPFVEGWAVYAEELMAGAAASVACRSACSSSRCSCG